MSAKLPNAESAWVEPRKLVEYLLALDHPDGGPKAKFFRGRGFSERALAEVTAALLHHAKHNDIVREKRTEYATNYSLDCHLPAPDGSTPCIRTVWELRPEDPRPRLITAHPLD